MSEIKNAQYVYKTGLKKIILAIKTFAHTHLMHS